MLLHLWHLQVINNEVSKHSARLQEPNQDLSILEEFEGVFADVISWHSLVSTSVVLVDMSMALWEMHLHDGALCYESYLERTQNWTNVCRVVMVEPSPKWSSI